MRNYREGKDTKFSPEAVFDILRKHHPTDWLLSIELYEIAVMDDMKKLERDIAEYLTTISTKRPAIKHLIDDGMQLVNQFQLG